METQTTTERIEMAEADTCYICGYTFRPCEVADVVYVTGDPAHGDCKREADAGYDDWRGVMTL